MLERLRVQPEVAAFETLIRERVSQLSSVEDERFARQSRVERDADTGELIVLAEFVDGTRLSDLLDATADASIVPGVDVALGYLLDGLPAVALLHTAVGVTHGLIDVSRTVLTPDGQIVFLDPAFGAAVERMGLSRQRLWTRFGIASPQGDGSVHLDASADIAQLALGAVALVLGRNLRPDEYPEALPTLLMEVIEVAQIRGSSTFATGLQRFLQRALPIPGRRPHSNADEALADVRSLVRRDIGVDVCRQAVVDFAAQMDSDFTSVAPAQAVPEPAVVNARSAAAQGPHVPELDDFLESFDHDAAAAAETAHEAEREPESEHDIAAHDDDESETELSLENIETDAAVSNVRDSEEIYDLPPLDEAMAVASLLPPAPLPPPPVYREPAVRSAPTTFTPAPVVAAVETAPAASAPVVFEPVAAGPVAAEPFVPDPVVVRPAVVPEATVARIVEPVIEAPPERAAAIEPAITTPTAEVPAPQPLIAAPVPQAQAEVSGENETDADKDTASSRRRKRQQQKSARARKDKLRSSNTVTKPAPPPPPPAPEPVRPATPSGWLVSPQRAAQFEPPVPAHRPVPVLPPPTPLPPQPIRPAPTAIPAVPSFAPTSVGHLPQPVYPSSASSSSSYGTKSSPAPALPGPLTAAPPPSPAGGQLKLRVEPPSGFTPKRAPHVEPPPVHPNAERFGTLGLGRPELPEDNEPRSFPWKLAAIAVVVAIAAILIGRSYLPGRTAVSGEPGAQTDPGAAASAATPAPPPAANPENDSAIPAGKGRVVIITQPAGVKVLVDRKAAGETPLQLDLPPGRRVLTFQTSGGDVIQSVRIVAGKTETLDLPVFSGWIAVLAPVILDVASDGKSIGNTDQSRMMLPPGKHLLTFTNKDLGYTGTQEVLVEPGEVKSVSVEPKGQVNLNALPWAEVWLDGTKLGDTPLAGTAVPIGLHEFVFKNPQFGERKVSATIKATGNPPVTVDFSK